MSKRVAIIGGGISGLAAANKLRSSNAHITIYEASDRFGGKIATDRLNDCLIERGADSFVASRPRIIGLCAELGIADELIGPTPMGHTAFIKRRGKLYPMPEGFSGLVPTKWLPLLTTGLLSPLGKLRMLLELKLPVDREFDDESVKSFVSRRFGREAYDRLFEPLLAGISSADGDVISLAATFPHWKTAELEYGSVIKGITTTRSDKPEKPRVTGFRSFRTGLGRLVEALTDALSAAGADLCLQTPVEGIDEADGQYTVTANGHTETYDAVVIALPAPAAALATAALDPVASRELAGIPQRSSTTVTLAFDAAATAGKLRGYGYLNTAIEGHLVSGATYITNKWAGRAPDEIALVRLFIGRGRGQRLTDAPESELVAVARDEVRRTTGISAEPRFHHIARWENAMPQYVRGHLERVSAIEQAIGKHRGLAIAGAWMRGVGIPNCVQSGEAAADHVAASLRD